MERKKRLTRREFISAATIGGTAAIIAACTSPTSIPSVEPTKSQAATQPAQPTQPPAATATQPAKPTVAPTAKGATSFSYYAALSANVAATMKNYNEIRCYQEAEKKTGVHIDFQHPAVGQETEQFNLMLASRKYPDLIEYNWLNVAGGPEKAIKDGVILKLNDLIDQNAPNLKKVFADHPDWKKQCVTDEGSLYVFPFLRGNPILWTSAGIIIRQDWLKKTGDSIPTTIDEWYTVLKNIKSKDPNGNGKADELPLSFTGKFWFDRTHAFVGAWGITTGFYQENNVVKFGPLQPEFKEFLKTMTLWFKEGLLDPEYASQDGKLFDSKMTGNLVGATIAAGGGGLGRYIQLMAPKDTNLKLVATPYPSLKKGETPPLGLKDPVFPGSGLAITTGCKDPVAAVKWIDFWYSAEGSMLGNFGVEGESYTMVNGYPTYSDTITKNPSIPMNQMLAKHNLAGFTGGPLVQDFRYLEQYYALPEQKDALKQWTAAKNEKQLPPVTPTADESKKFASIMNDVNTRISEMFDKFITGSESVDKFDDFIKTLKQMGIDDAVKIQQSALDRFNKRS